VLSIPREVTATRVERSIELWLRGDNEMSGPRSHPSLRGDVRVGPHALYRLSYRVAAEEGIAAAGLDPQLTLLIFENELFVSHVTLVSDNDEWHKDACSGITNPRLGSRSFGKTSFLYGRG
jgi:hypothetical protein